MRKGYLFTLLVSVFGALYFSPTLAQSTQAPNSTVPPSETASPPSSETSPAEGVDSNENTPTATEEGEVDYSKLEAALQQHNWEMADEETYQIMLKIAGTASESQGMFDSIEWQNFSCDDLRKIDGLWREVSEGKLGFAAQKRVYESVERNSARYYARINWKPIGGDWLVAWTYNEQTKRVEYLPNRRPNFEDPPEGHLPAKLEWAARGDRRFTKVYSCNL